jgi:hypothetical protein
VGINAILLVERATQLDNGISQVVLVLCLAGAIYTCGLFQLVRLHLPGPALTDESYVQPLMDRCAMGGVYDLKEKLRVLEGSFLRLPAWALLVVVTGGILVWVFAFNPVSRPLMTVEGSRFNQFATASLLVVQLAIALTLLKVVYGWHLLKQVLHRLSCHPLVETYARIPARLLPRTVFPRQPRFEELHVAVDHWRALRADEDGPPLDPSLPSVQDLETTFQSELAKQPGTAWLQSRTWQTLASAAGRLSADIQGQWIAEAVPGEQISSRLRFEASAKGDIHRRAAAPSAVAVEPRKWLAAAKRRRRRQEEFVALPIVFVIRDALARLGHQVVFVMGATFLVLCSHLLYSFQSKQHMLRIIWADILITVAVTLTVLVQVERNPVISRIASLSPDRLSWDREFVTKLFVYGLLPLLGLFATQFPGVGEGLMRWIEPVQRAIP